MLNTPSSVSIARELFLRAFLPGSLRSDAVVRMAEAMRDVFVAAGETFFREGDPPDHTYFVVDGEVRLVAEGLEPWTFGGRSVVGSIDVMADRPRTRTAIAVLDSHLLKVRREDWFDILEEYFEFTQATVMNMARGIGENHLSSPPDGLFPPARPPAWVLGAGPLDRVQRMLALRRMQLCMSAGVQVIASLAAAVTEVRVAVGDRVFEPGSESAVLFFIVQGTVDVDYIDASVHASFGPGDLVGGVTAIAGGRARARAIAREPCILLALREEDFFDEMEEHFDLARSTMAYLSLDREALLVERGVRAQKERASLVPDAL